MIDGVVRAPSEFSMTFGWPPSMMATQELVVPRSMPIILLMCLSIVLQVADSGSGPLRLKRPYVLPSPVPAQGRYKRLIQGQSPYVSKGLDRSEADMGVNAAAARAKSSLMQPVSHPAHPSEGRDPDRKARLALVRGARSKPDLRRFVIWAPAFAGVSGFVG